MNLIKNPENKEKFKKKFKELETTLNYISLWVDSTDRPIWDERDWNTLWDNIVNDNIDFKLIRNDFRMIYDREIRLDSKFKPNLDLSLFERIIAWWFINWYFFFHEYEKLLLEYWELKWEWDRYVKRFHLYLELFRFPDKKYHHDTNWKMHSKSTVDALNLNKLVICFEYQNNILWKLIMK